MIQTVGERDLVIRVNTRFITQASNKLREHRRNVCIYLHFRDVNVSDIFSILRSSYIVVGQKFWANE